MVKKTGDVELSYVNLIEKYDKQDVEVFLYEDLLKKCYDKNSGFAYIFD